MYGQNVSGSTETIIPALQNATSLVFQPIKLRFDFGEGQPFTLLPSQTLGTPLPHSARGSLLPAHLQMSPGCSLPYVQADTPAPVPHPTGGENGMGCGVLVVKQNPSSIAFQPLLAAASTPGCQFSCSGAPDRAQCNPTHGAVSDALAVDCGFLCAWCLTACLLRHAGLEAYSAIDFRFTMAEQGAQTFPQPFSSTSASTGLRIVENALQKVHCPLCASLAGPFPRFEPANTCRRANVQSLLPTKILMACTDSCFWRMREFG